jgi:uncharacterized protein YndB with AHSA1/START domain
MTIEATTLEAGMESNMDTLLVVDKHLEFDADIERVWDAITNPTAIARWFPDHVEIDEFAVGHRGSLVWEMTECAGNYEFEIEEVVPGERLVWRWAQDPNTPLEETPNTTVEWNLTPRPGGGTTLHLRESGFASEATRQGNDGGWDKELGELTEYLTA